MPSAHITRTSPVVTTGRILQMTALFDLPPMEKSTVEWDVQLPIEEKGWNVGLIVGPSGCGKSTIAKEFFGKAVAESFDWDPTKSVLDCFPKAMPTKEVVELISSVGFNSPPSWLRPFSVLSNGEQFRVTCARAMAENPELVVLDEFTSVVDRQVAQVASHAIQKTIRRRQRKLIAVACHYDIIEWLNPDWTYEPATGRFQWRELQRHPELVFDIREADRSLWSLFRQHHYLSGSLHGAAKCFAMYLEDRPVAFAAYTHFPHPNTKNIRMGHRLVVLPDFQGLGIGGRFDDWLGQWLHERKFRYRNCIAHPAMIAYYSRSPRWRRCSTASGKRPRAGKTAQGPLAVKQKQLRRLNVESFEYCPPKAS